MTARKNEEICNILKNKIFGSSFLFIELLEYFIREFEMKSFELYPFMFSRYCWAIIAPSKWYVICVSIRYRQYLKKNEIPKNDGKKK